MFTAMISRRLLILAAVLVVGCSSHGLVQSLELPRDERARISELLSKHLEFELTSLDQTSPNTIIAVSRNVDKDNDTEETITLRKQDHGWVVEEVTVLVTCYGK
jgi:hypothetical protein